MALRDSREEAKVELPIIEAEACSKHRGPEVREGRGIIEKRGVSEERGQVGGPLAAHGRDQIEIQDGEAGQGDHQEEQFLRQKSEKIRHWRLRDSRSVEDPEALLGSRRKLSLRLMR